MSVLPAKTQISLASAQSDQSLCCPHELSYTLIRLWSDWADAHTHFVGFVTSGSYVVPWFTVSPDMEIYRGDYWFVCFRVCSHSVLDKINNENRQTRCIVYGQQVQINYRSIFSGLKSITRKRNFHICKHVEATTFAAIRLDLLLYHNVSIVDLSPLGFLALKCEKRKVAQCDIWLHFSLSLVLNWLNFCSVGPSRQSEMKTSKNWFVQWG